MKAEYSSRGPVLQRFERLDQLREPCLVAEVELELPGRHAGRQPCQALGRFDPVLRYIASPGSTAGD